MTNTLVNPTSRQIMDLPIGAVFSVVGCLKSNTQVTVDELSYPGASSTISRKVSIVTIALESGEIVTLRGRSYPLTYAGGVLENLYDSPAIVGEKLSIEAGVVLGDNGRKVTTIGYAKATLLEPDAKRQEEYDELREEISGDLDMLGEVIAECDYKEARKYFAGIRMHKLTKLERVRLERLIATLPVASRPVYEPSGTHTRDELEKAYGVKIEALNTAEFLAFARRVLHGEIPSPDKERRVDLSYFFRYLELPGFATEQYAELVCSTLKIRMARLEQAGESYEEYKDDNYLVECCLSRLGGIQDPAIVNSLAWVIDYCLEHDYFDNRLHGSEERMCPRRFNSFLENAIRSLHDYARDNGTLPDDFDSGRLLSWRNTLSAYLFMGREADELRASIIPLTSL